MVLRDSIFKEEMRAVAIIVVQRNKYGRAGNPIRGLVSSGDKKSNFFFKYKAFSEKGIIKQNRNIRGGKT